MGSTKTPEPHPKLTLKFPGKAVDPKAGKDHPGVTVDNESLRRQQELVRAGSGTREKSAQPSAPTRTLRERVPPAAKSQTPAQGPLAPPTPKAKVESRPSQSPRGVATTITPHNLESKKQPNGVLQTPASAAQTPNGPSSRGPVAPIAPAAPTVNNQRSVPPRQSAAEPTTPSTTWAPRKYGKCFDSGTTININCLFKEKWHLVRG